MHLITIHAYSNSFIDLSVIIAVTKVDLRYPDLAGAYSQTVYHHGGLRNMIDMLSAKTGVPQMSIFPLINASTEAQLTREVCSMT